MGKNIWIVNYYTSPSCTHPRYLEFARHFMEHGWEVTTFYADFEGGDDVPLFERIQHDGLEFVKVRAPHYEGNGVKRMYSIWTFALRLFRHCKEFDKPGVVLHNIHTPFDYPVVWAAKRLKAKYVAEAWDLWPEDFVTFGLVSRKNPALSFFYWVEKNLYYHADELIFTFLGAFDYLKKKGWMKEMGGRIDSSHLHYINNGINLKQFDNDCAAYARKDSDMNDSTIKKIVYLGGINRANNIKTLIDAAALFMNRSEYRFFIYGDGAYRSDLEQYVVDNHIENVVFKEKKISYSECAWVVSQATVNVMNYEKNFGWAGVSSGKLFQYLAAGKPIVCNIDIAYDNVIKDNNLGVARDMETADDFASAIYGLAEQPKADYDAMCERVRETAKRYDYEVLAAEELKVIEKAYSI